VVPLVVGALGVHVTKTLEGNLKAVAIPDSWVNANFGCAPSP